MGRRRKLAVAQQLLQRVHIEPRFQQVRRITVPQGVGRRMLGQSRRDGCVPTRPLDRVRVNRLVVAALETATWWDGGCGAKPVVLRATPGRAIPSDPSAPCRCGPAAASAGCRCPALGDATLPTGAVPRRRGSSTESDAPAVSHMRATAAPRRGSRHRESYRAACHTAGA